MKSILSPLILCFILGGCGVNAPVVNFETSSFTESTADAIAMGVTFEIANTNDVPLKLLMFNYEVSADGSHVYSGREAALATVPRWSTIHRSIPIVMRRNQVQQNDIVNWNLRGTLVYVEPDALTQTIHSLGIWIPSTSLHASGAIEIPSAN